MAIVTCKSRGQKCSNHEIIYNHIKTEHYMIHLTDKEVYTDDATKVVHRIGTDIYATCSSRLPSDTIDCFEEVDEPTQLVTEEERKQRIQAKIHERYSLDDEIALLRQKDDSDEKRAAYEEYCVYAEMCKREVDAEIANH